MSNSSLPKTAAPQVQDGERRAVKPLAIRLHTIAAYLRSEGAGEMGDSISEAIDIFASISVGGNHLAHVLIKNLGADFSQKYPPDMTADIARREIGSGNSLDIWICWAAIMRCVGRPPYGEQQ